MVENKAGREFSLLLYLSVVCLISWPFQLPYLLSGEGYRRLLLVSMIMAGVGTWVAGRLVFRDNFNGAGFHWGKPWYYFLAFLLALLLWLLPVLVELNLGLTSAPPGLSGTGLAALFVSSLVITALPAFGEEFSWRGYLLPQLLLKHSPRQALLLHGLVSWFWHWPFLIAMGIRIDANPLLSVLAVLLISLPGSGPGVTVWRQSLSTMPHSMKYVTPCRPASLSGSSPTTGRCLY